MFDLVTSGYLVLTSSFCFYPNFDIVGTDTKYLKVRNGAVCSYKWCGEPREILSECYHDGKHYMLIDLAGTKAVLAVDVTLNNVTELQIPYKVAEVLKLAG